MCTKTANSRDIAIIRRSRPNKTPSDRDGGGRRRWTTGLAVGSSLLALVLAVPFMPPRQAVNVAGPIIAAGAYRPQAVRAGQASAADLSEFLPGAPRETIARAERNDAAQTLRIPSDPVSGSFLANVVINGVRVTAIIDTGAQATILSARDARETGADRDVMRSETMAGIGGYTRLNVTHIRSMEIGGQELGGFSAIIGQAGIPYTLLGQTELSRLGRIVIEHGVMTIDRGGDVDPRYRRQ